MVINELEINFFEQLAKKSTAKSKPLKEITLEESRANIASSFWLIKHNEHAPCKHTTAIMRDGYKISFTIYNHDLPLDAPVLFYFMGNGYIYDLYKVNSLICSRIAAYSKAKVIIANTRLAPEYPLPTAIYDGYDTIKYVLSSPQKFNIGQKNTMLAGYCTGATCAVAISNLAHASKEFTINRLILLNGIYDLTHSNQDYSIYEKEDISFSKEMLDYIIQQQNINESSKLDTLYSPIFGENFDYMPAVSLIVAEHDRNRSSTEAFYTKLRQHGIPAKKIILKGQTHNTIIFFNEIYQNPEKDPAKIIATIINNVSSK